MLSTALCLGFVGACKKRDYNEKSGVKGIPFVDEVADQLRVKIMVVSPDKNTLMITGVRSVSRFVAGANARPGCVKKDLPDAPGAPRASPHGKMRHFLNKSKNSGTQVEIELPLRVGRVLNYCGYSRAEIPEIEISGLDANGVFFQFRLAAEVAEKLDNRPQNVGVEFKALPRPTEKGDTLLSPAHVVQVGSCDTIVTVSFVSFPTESAPTPAKSGFKEVWSKIEGSKLDPKNLPKDIVVSDGRAAVGMLSHALGTDASSDLIRADQLRLLTETTDEKKQGRKSLHPFGLCSKAVWKVKGSQAYSGLFRPGTSVPAIIRYSANGAHTLNKAQFGIINHMYAVAVKLYPGADSPTPLESRNVLLFDDQGFLGNKSPYFLFNSPTKNTQFFANWGYGTNVVSHGSLKNFDKLVHDPRLAPLTKVAMVKPSGQFEASTEFRSPKLIKVWHQGAKKTTLQKDFRQDLLQYADNEIQLSFALYGDKADPSELLKEVPQVDGEISSISAPVLSTYCDEQLQFYHSPH